LDSPYGVFDNPGQPTQPGYLSRLGPPYHR
jgi:hypothetical protein